MVNPVTVTLEKILSLQVINADTEFNSIPLLLTFITLPQLPLTSMSLNELFLTASNFNPISPLVFCFIVNPVSSI